MNKKSISAEINCSIEQVGEQFFIVGQRKDGERLGPYPTDDAAEQAMKALRGWFHDGIISQAGAVIVIDLKGFSEASEVLENLVELSSAVLRLQHLIETFIEGVIGFLSHGEKAIRKYEGGDFAIVFYPDAKNAHFFVEALHKACTLRHNDAAFKHPFWFRVGGDYGTISYRLASNDKSRLEAVAGLAITIATRLQSKANPGTFVLTNTLKKQMALTGDEAGSYYQHLLAAVTAKKTTIRDVWLGSFVPPVLISQTVTAGLQPDTTYSCDDWGSVWPLVMFAEKYHTMNYLSPSQWERTPAKVGLHILRGVLVEHQARLEEVQTMADTEQLTKRIGDKTELYDGWEEEYVRRIFLLDKNEDVSTYRRIVELHKGSPRIPCRFLHKDTFDAVMEETQQKITDISIQDFDFSPFSITKLFPANAGDTKARSSGFTRDVAIAHFHYAKNESNQRQMAAVHVTGASTDLQVIYRNAYDQLWEKAVLFEEYPVQASAKKSRTSHVSG